MLRLLRIGLEQSKIATHIVSGPTALP